MNQNGHLPEGAILLTRAHLVKSIVPVLLPGRSAQEGSPIYVRIRPIRQAAYFGWLPALPDEAKDWPAEAAERIDRFKAWKAGLSPEVRVAWDRQDDEATYRTIEAGLVDPALSLDEIRLLGSDADVLAKQILVHSGLAEAPPESAGEKKADAASASTESAATPLPAPADTPA